MHKTHAYVQTHMCFEFTKIYVVHKAAYASSSVYKYIIYYVAQTFVVAVLNCWDFKGRENDALKHLLVYNNNIVDID